MDNNESNLDENNDNEFKLFDGNSSTETYKKKKKNLKIPAIIGGIVIILIGIVLFKKFIQNNNQSLPPNLNKNIFSKKNTSIVTEQPSINIPGMPITSKNNNISEPANIQNKTPNITLPEPANIPNNVANKTPSITLAEPANMNTSSNSSVKKNINSINDLFKLKNQKKSINKPINQPYAGNYPGQIPGQMQNPNFNGISPNIIQNIKSKINGISGDNYDSSGPVVIGVSNNFAAINYNGADLYLKSGDSFGNCTVMSMTSFNVKIACNNKLKKYPIEFIKEKKSTNMNNTINSVNTGGVKK